MGTIAIINIIKNVAINRFNCGSAQVENAPPTEYSITQPTVAIPITKIINAQFKCKIFEKPFGTEETRYSR